jgi:hypothetical protein
MKKQNISKIVFVLALVVGMLSSTLAFAHEADDNSADKSHRGLFMGINAGGGSSAFTYHKDTTHTTEERGNVGIGGLRFGYSFSRTFALSIEGFGFGHGECHDEGEEWGLGAGMLAATWHPGGHGFFLRVGGGVGGGEFFHPTSGERIELRERAAGLFSLGYDWDLNDSLTLGLSWDSMALDAGGSSCDDNDYIGASGLTVQFNWYL